MMNKKLYFTPNTRADKAKMEKILCTTDLEWGFDPLLESFYFGVIKGTKEKAELKMMGIRGNWEIV